MAFVDNLKYMGIGMLSILIVMGVLILKEKVSRRRVLGVAVIILGVIISRL